MDPLPLQTFGWFVTLRLMHLVSYVGSTTCSECVQQQEHDIWYLMLSSPQDY